MWFSRKKSKKMLKKGKIFENLDKNAQNWRYLEKGQVIACDYHMQWTARKAPGCRCYMVYFMKIFRTNKLNKTSVWLLLDAKSLNICIRLKVFKPLVSMLLIINQIWDLSKASSHCWRLMVSVYVCIKITSKVY